MNPDMQCTWWPDEWFGVSITHCCVAHDLGGTDWQLAVCVAQTSPWLIPVAAMMLVGVIFGRTIYRKIKRG
jgi:hypothetical protein